MTSRMVFKLAAREGLLGSEKRISKEDAERLLV
jgi:hypothetical protein